MKSVGVFCGKDATSDRLSFTALRMKSLSYWMRTLVLPGLEQQRLAAAQNAEINLRGSGGTDAETRD